MSLSLISFSTRSFYSPIKISRTTFGGGRGFRINYENKQRINFYCSYNCFKFNYTTEKYESCFNVFNDDSAFNITSDPCEELDEEDLYHSIQFDKVFDSSNTHVLYSVLHNLDFEDLYPYYVSRVAAHLVLEKFGRLAIDRPHMNRETKILDNWLQKHYRFTIEDGYRIYEPRKVALKNVLYK